MRTLKHHKALAAFALSFSILVWPACGRQQREAGSAGNGAIPIPNFHRVNQTVYRGGQPGSEAWQSLAKMGVKTVIDLRREDEHSTAAEAQAVAAAGIRVRRFAFTDPEFILSHDRQDALTLQGVQYASRAKILRVFAPDFDRSVFSAPLAERRRELPVCFWRPHCEPASAGFVVCAERASAKRLSQYLERSLRHALKIRGHPAAHR